MTKIAARIGEGLSECLIGFEYKYTKSHGEFLKPIDGGCQSIVCFVERTSQPRVARLSTIARIRIDRIEESYKAFHLYQKRVKAGENFTLVCNADNFIDSPVKTGFSTDDKSIAAAITEYSRALKANVLPWLNKYSEEDSLFNGYIDNDARNWINFDRETRFPVLLSVLANRKDWDEFERISDEFTKYCNKPHAQVHKPFADAMISGFLEEKSRL